MADEISIEQLIRNSNSAIALGIASCAAVAFMAKMLSDTERMPPEFKNAVRQVMLAHLAPEQDGRGGPDPILQNVVARYFE